MKGKKGVFLFLALLLPIFVFLFLKMFGKNEFAVKPLYQDVIPERSADCSLPLILPYHIPDSVIEQLSSAKDSLTLLWFTESNRETKRLFTKISDKYETLHQVMLNPSIKKNEYRKKCIFFLKNEYDVILFDRSGAIRGEYESLNREEMDRLSIELDIILKKY